MRGWDIFEGQPYLAFPSLLLPHSSKGRYMSSDSLKGKVAIVTGGGTLFGAAVAKTLINDGAKVMIV